MEMQEIKITLPRCPRCGRHCSIDQTACPRGQELVAKLLAGEMSPAEASAPTSRERGSQESRGDHSHAHHDHNGHHHHDHD